MSGNLKAGAGGINEVVIAPQTKSYLQQLPQLLASIPALSSLSQLSTTTTSTAFHSSSATHAKLIDRTTCSHCLSTIVPGLSGSVWFAQGSIGWISCEACGWRTTRGQGGHLNEDDLSNRLRGRARFERVKKRRKLEVKEEVSDVKMPASASARREIDRKSMDKSQAQADTARDTLERVKIFKKQARYDFAGKGSASTLDRARVQEASHTAIQSQQNAIDPAQSAQAPSIPVAAISTKSDPVKAVSSPQVSTKPASRKRKGQPNGLAEMLEAKRKKDAEEKAAAGKGGLLDFLSM